MRRQVQEEINHLLSEMVEFNHQCQHNRKLFPSPPCAPMTSLSQFHSKIDFLHLFCGYRMISAEARSKLEIISWTFLVFVSLPHKTFTSTWKSVNWQLLRWCFPSTHLVNFITLNLACQHAFNLHVPHGDMSAPTFLLCFCF